MPSKLVSALYSRVQRAHGLIGQSRHRDPALKLRIDAGFMECSNAGMGSTESQYRWVTPARRGPWLATSADACKSAKLAGVAHRDETGTIYLDALTWIEERLPGHPGIVRGAFVDRRMTRSFAEDHAARGAAPIDAAPIFAGSRIREFAADLAARA